jgi:hypothetical protein
MQIRGCSVPSTSSVKRAWKDLPPEAENVLHRPTCQFGQASIAIFFLTLLVAQCHCRIHARRALRFMAHFQKWPETL